MPVVLTILIIVSEQNLVIDKGVITFYGKRNSNRKPFVPDNCITDRFCVTNDKIFIYHHYVNGQLSYPIEKDIKVYKEECKEHMLNGIFTGLYLNKPWEIPSKQLFETAHKANPTALICVSLVNLFECGPFIEVSMTDKEKYDFGKIDDKNEYTIPLV